MDLFMCFFNTTPINLLTNLRFLPGKMMLDLKELGSAAPFQNKWQWSHEAALQPWKLCLYGDLILSHLYLSVEPLWSW